MRIIIATFSLFGLLLTGCTSMQPISSKPPESAIILKAPAIFPGFLYSVTFPAGEYRPVYEDAGGYYYQAPTKVIGHDFTSYMFDGGLYVERTKTEPTKWYTIDPKTGQAAMGHCTSLPEHTLIP
jgi:hypothetical protein